MARSNSVSPNAIMMLVIFVFTGVIFLGLGLQSPLVVYGTGAILIATTVTFALRNTRRAHETEGESDNERTRGTLHRLFLLLYVQYAYYWGTFAAGMYTNYYYAIPDSLKPTFGSIVFEVLAAPDLFTHVLMAFLSTSMSIPVIYLSRGVKLRDVTFLHVSAICVRTIGFIMGPLFLYYGTSAISIDAAGNITSLIMAVVFGVAVFLTLLSRIFIVREDVRLKSAAVVQPAIRLPPGSSAR